MTGHEFLRQDKERAEAEARKLQAQGLAARVVPIKTTVGGTLLTCGYDVEVRTT